MDGVVHGLRLGGVRLRAKRGGGIEARSRPQRIQMIQQRGDQPIVQQLRDEHCAGALTPLPVELGEAVDEGSRGRVHICVCAHDRGVVAARIRAGALSDHPPQLPRPRVRRFNSR